MKNAKAFTLIELLVVVLIIGILAAVALPQYQKAVEKSRGANALALLKSVGTAAQACYLATGSFCETFDQLDIDLPADYTGTTKWYNFQISDTRSNNDWSLQLEKQINGGGWESIHIGRLTGKYKGAGFSYRFTKSGSGELISKPGLSCSELKSHTDNPFSLSPGSYCQQLFHGTLQPETDCSNCGYRVYNLN